MSLTTLLNQKSTDQGRVDYQEEKRLEQNYQLSQPTNPIQTNYIQEKIQKLKKMRVALTGAYAMLQTESNYF